MAKITDMMQNLIMSNPKRAIWFMTSMKPGFWEKQGEKMALKTFHEAAEKVPAYKDFLKKHEIQDHTKIKTIDDFKKYVPLMDKDNYLTKYSLEDIIVGEISQSYTFAVSSGVTGKPLFCPISRNFISTSASGMEAIFDYFWDLSSKKVLLIIAMALGPWIGGGSGTFVYKTMCDKYENFTLVTTGTDVLQTLTTLQKVGKHYDLIILYTYPTLLKVILNIGGKEGIKFEDLNIKTIEGSEMLEPNLFDYFVKHLDPKKEKPWTIMDTYGSTEVGGVGFSTPLALIIRKFAQENEKISLEIFGTKTPFSLFQFNPAGDWLEIINEEIFITVIGKIPLIRYKMRDLGKIISWSEMNEMLKNFGINIFEELKKTGWEKPCFQWPFLSLLGRSDYAISIFGAKISPYNISFIFSDNPKIHGFKLSEREENLKPQFTIYLELQPSVNISKEEQMKMENYYSKKVVEYLLETNFDFKDAYSINKEISTPKIKIFSYRKGPFQEDIGKIKPKQIIN